MGSMNGLETKYAANLRLREKAGDVVWWAFECFRLRLGDQTMYTPDFTLLARTARGLRLECHETKGSFFREAARVRIRVAAASYPWIRFTVVRLQKGVWTFAPVPPGELRPDPAIREVALRDNNDCLSCALADIQMICTTATEKKPTFRDPASTDADLALLTAATSYAVACKERPREQHIDELNAVLNAAVARGVV